MLEGENPDPGVGPCWWEQHSGRVGRVGWGYRISIASVVGPEVD